MATKKGGIFWRKFIANFSSYDYDFVTLRLAEYTRDLVVVAAVVVVVVGVLWKCW